MKLADLPSSALAAMSATVASLCCLLPLAVVVLGLGSGAFMAVTMQYSYIFIPAGILGTGAGYYLYVRERRRCHRLECAMAASRVNLVLLLASSLVLAAAVVLTAFPNYTADLIASWGGTGAAEHGMGGPDRGVATTPSGGPAALVAAATATLQVDGMT